MSRWSDFGTCSPQGLCEPVGVSRQLFRELLLETDSTRMRELLVGLPDVNIDGVGDWPRWLRIAIITRSSRPPCPACAGGVWHHDELDVELVDLPCFGRRTRLVWSKSRWRCPNPTCTIVTLVEVDDRIAVERAGMTDRAGRWATFQVGHHGRAVSEVAADLGCDWHTVMDAVSHHGRALIDDPNRIGSADRRGRARRGVVLPRWTVQASVVVDPDRRRRTRPTPRRCAWPRRCEQLRLVR